MLTSRPDTREPRAVLRAWWPVAGVWLCVFAGFTFTRADADLWGHLRFGLDILRDWELPSVDPYSFTQDVPWINHEWLSELIMGTAVAAFGYAGIPVLKALLAGSAAVLLWRSLRGVHPAARILIAVVAIAGTIHATSTLRPQLWTLLFLVLECRWLSSGRRSRLFLLPVLFAGWVNLHGGWIVGLGVLAAWATVQVLADRKSARLWVGVCAACVVATLATPYGWKLWLFIATTVRMERAIEEWLPLWRLPWARWVPWIVAVCALAWAARREFPHRWNAIAALSMLAFSAARVQRIESLFVGSAAILLAPAIRQRWPAGQIRLQYPRPRSEGFVAAVVFAGLAAAAFALASRSVDCVQIRGAWTPDLEARVWLDSGPPGRLVVPFNWGQYAIWHFGPDLKVSMDGRRETVYSDRRVSDHAALVRGTDEGLGLLSAWRPDYAWLPATSARAREWLIANGYGIEYSSARSFIAVRADRPRLESRAAASRPCFPG